MLSFFKMCKRVQTICVMGWNIQRKKNTFIDTLKRITYNTKHTQYTKIPFQPAMFPKVHIFKNQIFILISVIRTCLWPGWKRSFELFPLLFCSTVFTRNRRTNASHLPRHKENNVFVKCICYRGAGNDTVIITKVITYCIVLQKLSDKSCVNLSSRIN